MQVSVVHCHRECKCAFCPELIHAGEPMVVGRYQMKKEGWYRNIRWHFRCWSEQALVHLEQHPYIPAHRGRKPLDLSDDDKQVRFALLRRRASILQRVNRMMGKARNATVLSPMEVERLSHLSNMLEEIKAKIETVGGTPKSWE